MQRVQVIRMESTYVPAGGSGSVVFLQVPPDVVRGRVTGFIFEVKPSVVDISIRVVDRDAVIPYWDVQLKGSFSTQHTFPIDVDIRPNMELKAIITNNATVPVSVTVGAVAFFER
jgi:hypothetical protein